MSWRVGLICSCVAVVLASCATPRSIVPDLEERISHARNEARRSVVTVPNETGGTTTTMYSYGVDAYMALLRDKRLGEQQRLLVAESAEANIDHLSTHRCDMETVLAELYFDGKDYEKAAHFSNLVLTTAGAMLETHRHKMVSIRVASLYRDGRHREAHQFIDDVIREEASEAENNRDWLKALAKWRERLSQKKENHNKRDAGDGK